MDSEKLIRLVRERRSLWDQTDKNYHVRNVHKKLWQEVSRETNESVDALKKRWRGLRDTYRKEQKKEMNSKSGCGSDEPQKSSWAFFKQLSFLADVVHSRYPESSVKTVEEDEDSQSLSDSFYESQCHSTPPHHTVLEPPGARDEGVGDSNELSTSATNKLFKSPLKKKRKWLWNECSYYDDKFLEIESKKMKYLEEQAKQNIDGDQQFLNSILPFLNDIPKSRKLVVRTKIMEVLIEELNRKETSHTFLH